MDGSSYGGLVAVMAVSGSVALVATQLQRRLSSEFMEKVKFELGGKESHCKGKKVKKVRFAGDVAEPSSNNEEYRKRRSSKPNTFSL